MHPSWCCTTMVFTDHAQITWNYAGDDLWSASCCALLLAENNGKHLKEEQNANKRTLPIFFSRPLIWMGKDAGDDDKYFLTLQMNNLNLDKFLALFTLMNQFVVFSESGSSRKIPWLFAQVYPVLAKSTDNITKAGHFLCELHRYGSPSFGVLMP